VPAALRVLAGACVTIAAVSAQQPVFRTTTQHVKVDVVVTDHRDRPVSDLTKDDFEIRENGTRQTITDFEFVAVPLAKRIVDVDAAPGPPSDVGSNAPAQRSSRAIVIFVDNASLSAVMFCETCVDVMVALKQALTRLLQSLSPDDQVALIWQGRSDLSQDFTNDIPRLIAAVNGRQAAMGMQPIGPAWRQRVESLKFAVDALAASNYARRAIFFVGARACNPVPSLSQSSNPGFEDVECKALYERARNANVPIYAIDPRVNPAGGDDTLAELAVNTGGRHFMQLSDPLAAVDEMITDNGSFYSLGFYPQPMVRDGKYHKLDVTVKRPGLRVRSRDRYLADTAEAPASTPKRDMTKALGSGLDDPGLPVRAFAVPIAAVVRGLTRTLVTLELTYPVPTGNKAALKDELRIGILALTPDAKVKASFQRPITFTGTWKPTARGTFVINETIDLPDDELVLRVGVTSLALGRTGTTHVPLDVPNYRKTDLQLSPLVIGSARQPLDAAVGLDVVRQLVPFQPTTARTFSATDELRVFARAYWGSGATTLDADVRIDDREVHHETIAAHLSMGRRDASIDKIVSLAGWAPGAHTLTVTATVGKQKSTRSIPFEIAGR
jgi:VWFA-related protein